jgi:hypothetical protein
MSNVSRTLETAELVSGMKGPREIVQFWKRNEAWGGNEHKGTGFLVVMLTFGHV